MGDRLSRKADYDPGTGFEYSNLTSHLLGIIVARACGTDLHFTARDMARFGLIYLNDGVHEGNRIISADWVHDSLRTYSEDAWDYRVGRNFTDIGYGYQWWSARAGDHRLLTERVTRRQSNPGGI